MARRKRCGSSSRPEPIRPPWSPKAMILTIREARARWRRWRAVWAAPTSYSCSRYTPPDTARLMAEAPVQRVAKSMKQLCNTSFGLGLALLLAALAINGSAAGLLATSSGAPNVVFAGRPQTVMAAFKNPANDRVSTLLRFRVLQLASSVAMPLTDELPWRELSVGTGETVLAPVEVNFPVVRSITRFALKWTD